MTSYLVVRLDFLHDCAVSLLLLPPKNRKLKRKFKDAYMWLAPSGASNAHHQGIFFSLLNCCQAGADDPILRQKYALLKFPLNTSIDQVLDKKGLLYYPHGFSSTIS